MNKSFFWRHSGHIVQLVREHKVFSAGWEIPQITWAWMKNLFLVFVQKCVEVGDVSWKDDDET